jgi:hypothetical protein
LSVDESPTNDLHENAVDPLAAGRGVLVYGSTRFAFGELDTFESCGSLATSRQYGLD